MRRRPYGVPYGLLRFVRLRNPRLITNSLLLLPYGTWTLLTAAAFFTPLDWALSAVLGVALAGALAAKTRGKLARMKPA